MMSLRTLVAIAFPIVAGTSVAAAQPPTVEGEEQVAPAAFTPKQPFVEVNGTWGFQFGVQPYVPNGMPGSSKQPLTNGFGGGVTAGYAITHDIELLLDWSHGSASSRTGEVTGALTSVEGDIGYNTLTAGARMARRLGPGRVWGQLAVGVILPFHTTIEYQYADSLAAIGIMGQGQQVDHYGTGIGGLGEAGYHVTVWRNMYVGGSLRLQTFQMSNDGQSTELNNFVTDFGNPTAVTASIHHGTSSAAMPTNYSVQDARIHLVVGWDFNSF
jgi:hypothetical protein